MEKTVEEQAVNIIQKPPKRVIIDFKNKFISLIGTFEFFALIMLILVPIVAIFFANSNIVDYANNYYDRIVHYNYSTVIAAFIVALGFFIVYSIRNTQAQSLIFGSTRTSHLLSNVLAGVAFSALFAIVSFLAELLSLFIMYHSTDYTISSFEYYLSAAKALLMAFSLFFIFLCSFFTANSVIGAVIKKRYFQAIIPLIMLGVYAFIVSLIEIFSIQNGNAKLSLLIYGGIFTIFIGGFDAAQTLLGGIRR